MTAVPDADPVPRSDSPIGLDHTTIQQTASQNEGQVIGSMTGGMAIGQVTVYLSQMPMEKELPRSTATLGDNPYQGLKAFREADGDRFFGRDRHIQDLWQRFQSLHNTPNTIRLLPIYGPSGSGKSSLARAGLVPALGRQPLPGRDRARVAVLTPGTHPLDALATVLARIVTQDPTPIAKADEFRAALLQTVSNQQHDGLRRIAGVFPDIDALPLIVLVDQFEELYTLCDDEQERNAFVDNLLVAACDRAQQVSVIITMRSDFLGATQQHPQLNQLFSSQGFLVPSMTPDDLAVAIAAPAKQAGYELDKATVQLLVHEAQGQEGALPLLQFALTQIWEGLRQGIEPADTLERIGGVGGAVATEAQRIYNSLSEDEQAIARCIFLSLIQLNDDKTATRRRASISGLITEKNNEVHVRNIIYQFARPGVWILVTSANQQQIEMVEVAHESLIHSWAALQQWLGQYWDIIRQKNRIEQVFSEWKDSNRDKDNLLKDKELKNAKYFLANEETAEILLSSEIRDFIVLSHKARCRDTLRNIILFLLIPSSILVALAGFMSANYLATITDGAMYQGSCIPNSRVKQFLSYESMIGRKVVRNVNLCNQDISGFNFYTSTFEKIENSEFTNTNFSGVVLYSMLLERVTISGGNNAAFTNANLNSSTFAKSQFTGVNLSGALLNESRFIDTVFSGVNFDGTQVNGAIFVRCDLSESKINPERLALVKLCNVNLPAEFDIDTNRDCENQDVLSLMEIWPPDPL